MANRITVRMDSKDPNAENVSLRDFLKHLDAMRSTLKKLEALLEGVSVLDWRVVDLSHNSPATVVLEPALPSEGYEDYRENIVGYFFEVQNSLINNADAPSELDRETLLAFQKLNDLHRNKRIKSLVSNGKGQVPINGDVSAVIRNILASRSTAQGTVDGHLEMMNIHGKRSVFRIYPIVGPDFIDCRFYNDQLEEAKSAIGSKVRVYGELTYRERDPYPSFVKVESLERFPSDEELPSILDLHGIAPNITGELSSEDFVRALRDAE